jgi:hypothetical protein
MHVSLPSAILVTIISSCSVYAQPIGTVEHTRNKMVKVENALIISWDGSSDANANHVEIFDEQGHSITSLNVLRPVQEASQVSISDVSARPGSVIAVAAVYASKEGNRRVRPVASLLLFDFNGHLLSAFALEPSRGIVRLAVDDKSNVWTLTGYADNKDPSTIAMVVQYTPEGIVARKLFTRNMFPFHASETWEDTSIGRAFMGYDSGLLWFWLPGSTELVTVSVGDGKSVIAKTQLPKRVGRTVVPSNLTRESSGKLVAQVYEIEDHGEFEIANYTWSAGTGSWSPFKPDTCDGARFIGVGDGGRIYLRYEADGTSICTY